MASPMEQGELEASPDLPQSPHIMLDLEDSSNVGHEARREADLRSPDR